MREQLQTKLNELSTIDCGIPISDDILEDNKTYFGYQIEDNLISVDGTRRINITGHVLRKDNNDNSVSTIDNAVLLIKEKLEELNMHISIQDVSLNDIIKVRITGYASYNEINKGLI